MGATLGLLLLSPVFMAIAIAIRVTMGSPVLFRQTRLGLNGKPFRIWKFRSMVVGADLLLDSKGRVKGKGRLTGVGRVLRRFSLDELPQLLNITRGDLCFVGPRAALPEHLPRYTERQKRRLRVKPGLTGLAQVNGRNTLKWSERIEYDLWYIQNYSWLLDLTILLRTIKVVLLGEGIVLDRNPEHADDLGRVNDGSAEDLGGTPASS